MGDGPKTIRIIGRDALDNLSACQRRNRLSGAIHQRRDLFARNIKDNEAAC
jgi:hypothetical protein